MSYRLIDANALAICKEVNDMSCIYADLPNGLDGGHYDMAQSNTVKSRWYEMFGTPDRAARTLESLDEMSCKYCLVRDHCGDSCLLYGRDDALLAWLNGDA